MTISGALGDGEHFLDQVFRDIQLPQGAAQVLHHHIEMMVVEAHLDQTGVAAAHVLAGVVVRTAEGHGQESLLLGSLLGHVDAKEEIVDAGVADHLAVEDVHGGVDRGFAAELVVQGGVLGVLGGVGHEGLLA